MFYNFSPIGLFGGGGPGLGLLGADRLNERRAGHLPRAGRSGGTAAAAEPEPVSVGPLPFCTAEAAVAAVAEGRTGGTS